MLCSIEHKTYGISRGHSKVAHIILCKFVLSKAVIHLPMILQSLEEVIQIHHLMLSTRVMVAKMVWSVGGAVPNKKNKSKTRKYDLLLVFEVFF